MAWDKSDITQASSTTTGRWDKADELQAQITDAKPRHTTSQILKQNEKDALQEARSPAQNANGPSPDNTIRKSTEEDRVQLSADVKDLAYVSRQSDSPINKGPNEMILEKKLEEKPGPMKEVHEEREKPSEQAEQMNMILSGDTPYKMSAAEESKSSLFGGYSQDVEKLAEVDQDHPASTTSVKAIIKAAEQERPEEKTPGAVESEIGQTVDKLV